MVSYGLVQDVTSGGSHDREERSVNPYRARLPFSNRRGTGSGALPADRFFILFGDLSADCRRALFLQLLFSRAPPHCSSGGQEKAESDLCGKFIIYIIRGVTMKKKLLRNVAVLSRFRRSLSEVRQWHLRLAIRPVAAASSDYSISVNIFCSTRGLRRPTRRSATTGRRSIRKRTRTSWAEIRITVDFQPNPDQKRLL